MNRLARAYSPLIFVALAIGAWPLACNVFVSLDRCRTDDDCPPRYTCDPQMRFCVSHEADSEADVVEASLHDVSSADVAPDASADVAADAGADVAPDAGADVDSNADADADAGPPCNLAAPFTSITLVKGLEQLEITSARLASDETTMILSMANGCPEESCIDLFLAARSGSTSPFVVSGPMPGVNSTVASEYWPSLTSTRLLLFFDSSRSLTKVDGGYVNDRGRIWTSTRNDPLAQFGEPYIQDIFVVAPDLYEGSSYLHPNGKTLYFASTGRPGNKGELDIFVAELGDFGAAKSITNLAEANSAITELMPLVSVDERVLYFARDDGFGRRIMVSSRSSPSVPFNTPTPVTELNVASDWPSWLSDDQCRLYFVSTRSVAAPDAGADGGDAGVQPAYRLWVAEHPK